MWIFTVLGFAIDTKIPQLNKSSRLIRNLFISLVFIVQSY